MNFPSSGLMIKLPWMMMSIFNCSLMNRDGYERALCFLLSLQAGKGVLNLEGK